MLNDADVDHGSIGGLSDDDHTQYSLVDGSRDFTGAVGGITPVAGSDLTTKDYVDSAVQGVEWQDSVLDRDLTAPPGGETTGDRYIVAATATGAWAGQEDNIAEWNGSSYDFTTPTTGMTTAVDDETRNVRWNGSAWVFFGTTIDHGNLAGTGDDDHTQYHNDTRGDVRYYQKSEHINSSAGAGDAGKPIVLDAGGHVDATMINDADINLDNVTEGSTNKFFTATDETKLDGIETGADVTDATNVAAAGAQMESDLTTKGDLYARGASDVLRLPVGTNGQELISDSAQTTGLKWVDREAQLTFTIDGGGSAITTGTKYGLRAPYAMTIATAELVADQSGSIVLDVWKDTYASFPPLDADSITASAPPTLSTAQKSQDSTLTGWTKTVAKGDYLWINVDSASTVTWVQLNLYGTRDA
jgi:hypothetical protein